MITATRSRLFFSAGLMTFVSLAGCQNQKCHTCQNSYDTIHVMPHDSYPYAYDSYPYNTEYGMPVEEYRQPMPAETPEPAPVPIPNTPDGSNSAFPPAPESEQVNPPEPPDSTTDFRQNQFQNRPPLQTMNPRTQFEQSRIIHRPQPRTKTDTTATSGQQRRLLPKSIRPPRVLKPIGEKMRSMFEAVKGRMPSGRSGSRTTKTSRRPGKQSRGRSSAKIARRTKPTATPKQQIAKSPTVLLMTPQFDTRQPVREVQIARRNPPPIAQTQMTQFVTPVRPQPESWETRIPRNFSGPSFGGYSQSRTNSAQQMEMWPYAKSFSN